MTVTTLASEPFFQAVETRRSYYNLTNKMPISDAQLQAIVERAVKYVPSSYNTQTSRAVVVIGDKHTQLWDAVWDSHKQLLQTPVEVETYTKKFETAYKPAYATVVFFEDSAPIDAFAAKMPGVAGPLAIFSSNTAGMVQFIVWSALAAEGVGANLQHFAQFSQTNEVAIRKFLGTPETWKCTALMPVGVPADKDAPGPVGIPPKTFQPIEERVRVVV